MSEKVAIVTEGNRGIGASICKILGKAGYFLYINYVSRDEEAVQILSEIVSTGGKGKTLKFDVRNDE